MEATSLPDGATSITQYDAMFFLCSNIFMILIKKGNIKS